MRFRCYGTDGDDLTALVVAVVGEPAEERLKTSTVRVACTAGHKNVFGRYLDPIPVLEKATGRAGQTSPVVGRPPTPAEELLAEDAQRFAPSKSLERLDAHATFIFANVGIIGTLIAALDLFKPERPSAWIILPLALAAISLGCAAFALTPKYQTVKVDDLQEVRKHYVRILRTRGVLIRAAGICFALALFTTPFVFSRKPPVPPALITSASSFKITRAPEGDTASVHVEFTNVPPDTTLHTTLAANSPAPPLATYTRRLPAGDVKLDLEHPIPAAAKAVVKTVLTRAGTPIYEETIDASIPPPALGGLDGNKEIERTNSKGSGSSKGQR